MRLSVRTSRIPVTHAFHLAAANSLAAVNSFTAILAVTASVQCIVPAICDFYTIETFHAHFDLDYVVAFRHLRNGCHSGAKKNATDDAT